MIGNTKRQKSYFDERTCEEKGGRGEEGKIQENL